MTGSRGLRSNTRSCWESVESKNAFGSVAVDSAAFSSELIFRRSRYQYSTIAPNNTRAVKHTGQSAIKLSASAGYQDSSIKGKAWQSGRRLNEVRILLTSIMRVVVQDYVVIHQPTSFRLPLVHRKRLGSLL